MLDKLVLLRALNALPRRVATALTFAVVAIGWTIFRARSLDQAASHVDCRSGKWTAGPGGADFWGRERPAT